MLINGVDMNIKMKYAPSTFSLLGPEDNSKLKSKLWMLLRLSLRQSQATVTHTQIKMFSTSETQKKYGHNAVLETFLRKIFLG
jgi:hypothetical protein